MHACNSIGWVAVWVTQAVKGVSGCSTLGALLKAEWHIDFGGKC